MKIKVLHDNVLVELPPVKEKMTDSGISLGDKVTETRDFQMTVVAVGDDVTTIKAGDFVEVYIGDVFNIIKSSPALDNNKQYAIIKEKDVIAIYEE